ncbi:MAG: RNB domain-containing ribonuclease [Spirochaetota bacterium]|jgi:exoribonuclease-2|nr:RNB domain-containing ribonuclease [Spirochaetota bacterium]
MDTGQLIDFLDDDAIETVLVIQEAPTKLQVVTQFGKQKTIKANQIVCRFGDTYTREELAITIPNLRQKTEALASEIDSELLWAGTEPKEKDFAIKEIARNYFGEGRPIRGEEISAICRVLLGDPIRYKRNGLAFQARSEAHVAALLLAGEREAAKKEKERAIGAWLARLLSPEFANGDDAIPADDQDEGVDTRDSAGLDAEFLQALAAFLIDRRESDVSRLFCEKHRDNPREAAFAILSRRRLLPADCNPIKLIAGINPEFSRKALAETEALAAENSVHSDPHERLDLTHLPAFSIDDALTMEIDDAFTIERSANNIRIGIHIADAASLIPLQGAIDNEAQARTLTVYLPEQTFTMLPPRIGTEIVSLRQGERRAVLSLLVELDAATLLPARSEFRSAWIQNAHRLTYEQVDAILADEAPHPLREDLDIAYSAALKLKAERLSRKAFLIARPEMRAHVENGKITLTVIREAGKSSTLVQELMILYNASAARFAQNAALPVIYRVQAPPDGKDFPVGRELVYEPHTARALFKRIRPARLSLEAGAHAGLGEDAYIQATSPIRRYGDLIMQRQLLAHIRGRRPVYEQGELYRVLAAVEDTSREISAIERSSIRFWALEYLARAPEQEYTAIALFEVSGGTLVELEEYPLRAILEGARLKAGERIPARISHVDARSDILRCVPVA